MPAMKKPALKRKVTTYTIVSWELTWEDDDSPEAQPPMGDSSLPVAQQDDAGGAPAADAAGQPPDNPTGAP